MKRILIYSIIALTSLSIMAETKTLPTPDKEGGIPVMQAFSKRKSVRNFSNKELNEQELSNLLWAACGVNREDGRITAPSCLNYQEIRLFVFDKNGVSEYISANHTLEQIVKGDYRALVAGPQEFAKEAPISLVMIADMTKFGDMKERSHMMASVDAGIVSQNISIACAGLGLATVPRATMLSEEIIKLLNLPSNHVAIMNNPVGFEAVE